MERGEEAPVEGAPAEGALAEGPPVEGAPAEGAPAEGAPAEGGLAEAGAPDISEAPSTDAPTSGETGPKEPQGPVSLGAEGDWDTADTGGARGLVPVPSRAEAPGTRPSTARGRALQKTVRAMSLRHEESHEIEEQFILRLPPEQAYAVRKIIHSRNASTKDKLKIGFSPDGHHAVVQVEDVSLPAKLVNLPCVIGSLKTVDRKTFYKTADISQMLVCSPEGEPHSSPEEPVISTGPTVTGHIEGKAEKKKYNWKHGITPPLKNVRKKRFRKTTKKLPDVKQMDEINFSEYTQSPSVEKEVKRLLCSDAEAVSVRWEVVADDDSKEIESQGCISTTSGTPQTGGASSLEYDMFREMMGESGSNSNDMDDKNNRAEEEDDDDQEDEDEDDGNEEKEEETDNSEEELEKELQVKFTQFSLHEKDQDYTSIIMEIQKLIHIKEQKLQQIYKKAQRQKDLLRNVENLTLKRHFQNVLERLNILEKEKCEQIYHLQEQLKCFLKE